jgi:hypothetical protein
MFQIVLTWNLSKPNQHIGDLITHIDIRGSRKRDIRLPPEYSNRIRSQELKSLSISNIADKICPTRRDLYYRKGINPPNDVPETDSWGSKAGPLVEKYLDGIKGVLDVTPQNYSNISDISNQLHDNFKHRKSRAIDDLTLLEKAGEEGNTEWLQSLLNCNMRAELGAKVLHSLLNEGNVIDFSHIHTKRKLHPNILEIGISDGVEPDFILPDFGIVGDIKTGIQFEPYHQLTCAGYALAYENEMKWKHNNKKINWGIVYFIQTRLESEFVKSLTMPQIYIFPIDNKLRETFLTLRNEGYRIISKITIPNFPEASEKEKCQFCRYFDYCKKKGLVWP